MPLGVLGYRGVRTRPSGVFSADTRSGDMRLGLDTFETAHEAARAYDAAVWRPWWPRRDMNFPKCRRRSWRKSSRLPRGLSPTRIVATTGGGSAVSPSPRWTRKPWSCGANCWGT
nr:ethylene-responsive transcription factor 1A-like [Aegilops tauschii subsp. strangulata]